MRYDINKPVIGDSIKVDLAFGGFWHNTIPKKYTYGWIYNRLREGYEVQINSKYVNAVIKGLNDRMGQRGYPKIDITVDNDFIKRR